MIPTRSCVICRRKGNKAELLRIVSNNNIAVLDHNQKMNTRGIYICHTKACLEKMLKLLDRNKVNIKISLEKETLRNVITSIKNELGE